MIGWLIITFIVGTWVGTLISALMFAAKRGEEA